MPPLHLLLLVLSVAAAAATAAADDFFTPFLPPFFDKVCEDNVCGKGNCTASKNSTFGFECACDQGWRRTLSEYEDDDDHGNFKFLPCLIPNCTLNYNCSDDHAPPPASQGNRKDFNFSVFDPCYWTDCGGGTCNKTSPFTHTCECDEGYYNLLNSSAFPCFKRCAVGGSCVNLGLDFSNTSNSSKPTNNLQDQGGDANHAAGRMNLGVGFSKSITAVAALALVMWLYI